MNKCRRCKEDFETLINGYCRECKQIKLRLRKRKKRFAEFIDNLYVYVLIDPLTTFPRYVGIARNYNKRFAAHLQEARYDTGMNTAKNKWIAGLLEAGLEPIMIVVGQAPKDEIHKRELEVLGLLIKQGFDMLNINGVVTAQAIAYRQDKFAHREFEAKETYKIGRRNRKSNAS